MTKQSKFFLLFLLFMFSSCAFAQQPGGGAGERTGLDIKTFLEQALPDNPDRIISFDPARNIINITDTPTNHALIEELINEFDRGPQQVTIETKFVEVSVGNLNELGTEWYFYQPGTIGGSNSDVTLNSSTSTNNLGIQWDSTSHFPSTNLGVDLFISATRLNGEFIRARIHAMEQEGKANVLSSPRVTTLSGQMANIQVTQTIPYVNDVTLTNVGTADHPQYRFDFDFSEVVTGITLEVTPRVGEATELINLDLHPSIDVLLRRVPIHPLAPSELGWPVIDTRTTQTSVVIRSGETIVLGGLIQDEDKSTVKGIPFISKIPFLGKAFTYNYRNRTKKNLLIFVTATLVGASGEGS